MEKRIYRSFMLITMTALAFVAVLCAISFYTVFASHAEQRLQLEMDIMGSSIGERGDTGAYLREIANLNTQSRYTWIDPSGKVLYDSIEEALRMDNHLDRSEVASAFEDGFGRATRISATQDALTIYIAHKLPDGTVLRLSSEYLLIWAAMYRFAIVIVLLAVGVLIFSMRQARKTTRNIVAPINTMNLDAPDEGLMYDELSPLILRLNQQKVTIARQFDTMMLRQREFDTIVENMSEGLIVLDAGGLVLSINRSALNIMGVEREGCIGRNIALVNRSPVLRDMLDGEKKASDVITMNNRAYQVMISPVVIEEFRTGAIVLIWEVTEAYQAEAMRREFTANVSHELKTPLTSISGYAELMSNGMARQEDVPAFAHKILDESHRLLTLIEDILLLSRLDEKRVSEQWQSVNLHALCEKILARISRYAAEKNIELALCGEDIAISGLPLLLDEMIYNLVDNAIKYGRQNGEVKIELGTREGNPFLSVRDDGIGIPTEDQPKVFERFFRVDKNRSRLTGGTGLGLSIVKHSAQIHDAKIELDSRPDKGTKVTVVFQREAEALRSLS